MRLSISRPLSPKYLPFALPVQAYMIDRVHALFLMYINDVVGEIENCSCYLYADDMVIYKPLTSLNSLGKLQTDMDKIYQWYN